MATRRLFQHEAWQTCYSQFLASLSSQNTRTLYACILQRFFADGATPDRKTRADVEAFLVAPTSGPVRPGRVPAPATQNGRYQVLSSFYHWCASYEVRFRGHLRPILRGTLPVAGIKQKKTGYSERDMEPGELSRFFAVIDRTTLIGARDYALFLALFLTARRHSEITQLRWCDLEQVTFVEDGTTRQGWQYRWQGKGHVSRDDRAEWPEACMAALRTYLEMAGKWGQMQPDDYLFAARCAGNGTRAFTWRKARPIGVGTVDRRFRIYAQAAGLPRSRVPHSLRHESAWQRYQANGHDILRVQYALRHRAVQTTMIYIQRRERRHQGDHIANILAATFARKEEQG